MSLTFNKRMFLDLELTGLDVSAHGIHEIAAILCMENGSELYIHEKVRPHPFAQIEPNALKVSGTQHSDLLTYPMMDVIYRRFVQVLQQVCDPTNPNDKFIIVGYGSAGCDHPFLREWFRRNGGEQLFKAFFHSMSEDVSTLAIRYMRKHNISPSNLKLSSVAHALGIPVMKDKLHGAMYDVELARDVYKIVSE